ncbi:MAG: hypothetical protein F4Z29_05070 [Gemmatimonadetes bacterium]|nr:hypothetical protein [Gemmatimonadota bacterium]
MHFDRYVIETVHGFFDMARDQVGAQGADPEPSDEDADRRGDTQGRDAGEEEDDENTVPDFPQQMVPQPEKGLPRVNESAGGQ